ncbi:Glycosyl transferase [hydrothermal vent metagenome]|uniref:Glycosyl transferase n=1 Tax=hydrothermal vent metagenome TaxID=652676 RepID=A0A3B1BVJ4_9ZZZZ
MKLNKYNKETVSIILPTFNRAEYLSRSINSVIAQSYSKWELVIIDDGSSDNTKEMLRSYLVHFPNIKYFYHSNKGVALSMNEGIKRSSGEFITFLGSDDEYLPDHLKLRIEYFNSYKDTDLIHTTAKIVGNKFVKDKNDLSKNIHLDECILGGTLFGRRKIFKLLNGFNDVSYSPESDFIERSERKFHIQKLDLPTYIYYRDTPDSICNAI